MRQRPKIVEVLLDHRLIGIEGQIRSDPLLDFGLARPLLAELRPEERSRTTGHRLYHEERDSQYAKQRSDEARSAPDEPTHMWWVVCSR
jgi:hypothetical protein